MKKILVLYYSRHGSVAELARCIARGIDEHDGYEACIRTVPDVSPGFDNHQKPVPDDGPPYATLADLENCDALALGSPAYFGNMAAPLKYFIDTTSGVWLAGKLSGKPACVFTSTSSLHGGQEVTLLNMMVPLMHHGMLLCGLPYSEASLNTTRSGGTPYGVTHFSTVNNNTVLSDEEKELAVAQGRRLAHIASLLAGNPSM